MDLQVALLLAQNGVTNGAVYGLLAISILLVFSVTRVLFIPQGEFVTFAALTMAAMQGGKPVRLGWLLLALTAAALVMDLVAAWRLRRRFAVARSTAVLAGVAVVLAGLAAWVPFAAAGPVVQAAMTIALIVPLGPLLYRVCFQPIAAASALVLLVVAIAAHVALVGIGLLVFGPEGARTEPFTDAMVPLGPALIQGQTLWIIGVSLLLVALLYVFFERHIYGKALRATAIDRLGAELVGVSPELAGKISMAVAAFIGGLSGVLIAPVVTIYFDSGFIISLKGFVGALVGGLASYPLAALGALLIGQAESFATFWASSYKEVIVFTLLLPVLLWRSLATRAVEDDE